MPGSSCTRAAASLGSRPRSASVSSCPFNAALATACSRSILVASRPGKLSTASSAAGLGKQGSGLLPPRECPRGRPKAVRERSASAGAGVGRTARSRRLPRRPKRTAAAAGPPVAAACSRPITGSRSPTAANARPSTSSDSIRATLGFRRRIAGPLPVDNQVGRLMQGHPGRPPAVLATESESQHSVEAGLVQVGKTEQSGLAQRELSSRGDGTGVHDRTVTAGYDRTEP